MDYSLAVLSYGFIKKFNHFDALYSTKAPVSSRRLNVIFIVEDGSS